MDFIRKSPRRLQPEKPKLQAQLTGLLVPLKSNSNYDNTLSIAYGQEKRTDCVIFDKDGGVESITLKSGDFNPKDMLQTLWMKAGSVEDNPASPFAGLDPNKVIVVRKKTEESGEKETYIVVEWPVPLETVHNSSPAKGNEEETEEPPKKRLRRS